MESQSTKGKPNQTHNKTTQQTEKISLNSNSLVCSFFCEIKHIFFREREGRFSYINSANFHWWFYHHIPWYHSSIESLKNSSNFSTNQSSLILLFIVSKKKGFSIKLSYHPILPLFCLFFHFSPFLREAVSFLKKSQYICGTFSHSFLFSCRCDGALVKKTNTNFIIKEARVRPV